MRKLFIENRKRFAKELDEVSLYIAFAGKAPIRSADQHYPFCPKRNFYYLTGIENPSIILTMYKDKTGEITETLYLERYDEVVAKWDGAVLNREDAKERSGIEKFRDVEDFKKDMAGYLYGVDKLHVLLDLENRYFAPGETPEARFAAEIKDSYPHIRLENAYPILTKLRTIKSKEEIKQLQKACDLTGEAIMYMMENSKPGMMEYEYSAYFDFHLRKNGVRQNAFNSICGSGKNATILHYKDNNCKTKDGDMILFDLGGEWGYYAADISRTFPVNGVFTARQKELYNIVLEAQRKVIAKIKPGVPYKELNEIVINHYAKELKSIGLIKEKDEVAKYYYHGVGHMLGLDVHDPGKGREFDLKKGMVLTVEPGLYIAEENIGIRIEDDVLVTENGCQVLSAGIIKTVEDIEAFMAKKPVSRPRRTTARKRT